MLLRSTAKAVLRCASTPKGVTLRPRDDVLRVSARRNVTKQDLASGGSLKGIEEKKKEAWRKKVVYDSML